MLTARQKTVALLTLCLLPLVPGPAQAAPSAPSAPSSSAPSVPARADGARIQRRPVVLVHGYNADPGVWGSLRSDLRAAGWTDADLFSWGYDTHQSVNEVLSGQLAGYVDEVRRRTGADRVDIVSHSFGSLVSRWYVKFGGGAGTVDHWVSLAGPNHGTSTAWACALWDQACRDMTPNSYVQKNLASGDETPGAVKYATFWSTCDEVVNPDSSVPLAGAANTGVGCLQHNDLLGDPGTKAGVRAFLAS
ncbi:triacylglycerol lipase [Streptomyces sp. WAC06614]|uniref:esterase/lipase family protein n=1 Tax=Streptomyces sp. WAC06614 TaxID=2487416 RepID=UPI000F769E12|nr:triacylglycerol lipase [Streptomyces sp. WAC06614]RSS56239.1 triacylglycerol lipase [Streptomyces sp. WAC06614]